MRDSRLAGTRRMPPYATVSQFFSRGRGGAVDSERLCAPVLLGSRTIEHRFPKPQVACSIHAGGAKVVS